MHHSRSFTHLFIHSLYIIYIYLYMYIFSSIMHYLPVFFIHSLSMNKLLHHQFPSMIRTMSRQQQQLLLLWVMLMLMLLLMLLLMLWMWMLYWSMKMDGNMGKYKPIRCVVIGCGDSCSWYNLWPWVRSQWSESGRWSKKGTLLPLCYFALPFLFFGCSFSFFLLSLIARNAMFKLAVANGYVQWYKIEIEIEIKIKIKFEIEIEFDVIVRLLPTTTITITITTPTIIIMRG